MRVGTFRAASPLCPTTSPQADYLMGCLPSLPLLLTFPTSPAFCACPPLLLSVSPALLIPSKPVCLTSLLLALPDLTHLVNISFLCWLPFLPPLSCLFHLTPFLLDLLPSPLRIALKYIKNYLKLPVSVFCSSSCLSLRLGFYLFEGLPVCVCFGFLKTVLFHGVLRCPKIPGTEWLIYMALLREICYMFTPSDAIIALKETIYMNNPNAVNIVLLKEIFCIYNLWHYHCNAKGNILYT